MKRLFFVLILSIILISLVSAERFEDYSSWEQTQERWIFTLDTLIDSSLLENGWIEYWQYVNGQTQFSINYNVDSQYYGIIGKFINNRNLITMMYKMYNIKASYPKAFPDCVNVINNAGDYVGRGELIFNYSSQSLRVRDNSICDS